jgi:hypothetical protein
MNNRKCAAKTPRKKSNYLFFFFPWRLGVLAHFSAVQPTPFFADKKFVYLLTVMHTDPETLAEINR